MNRKTKLIELIVILLFVGCSFFESTNTKKTKSGKFIPDDFFVSIISRIETSTQTIGNNVNDFINIELAIKNVSNIQLNDPYVSFQFYNDKDEIIGTDETETSTKSILPNGTITFSANAKLISNVPYQEIRKIIITPHCSLGQGKSLIFPAPW